MQWVRNLPCTANASRHVRNIEDEQAEVVRRVARNSHAFSSRSRCNIGAVNPDVDLVIVRADQAIIGSIGSVKVGHIAAGWIRALDTCQRSDVVKQ